MIATGSLLEFALEDISSFGVGRIEYLYMYPVTFHEFLVAFGEALLLEQIRKSTPLEPLPDPLHGKALSLLKTYLSLGGMPEVLATYGRTKSLRDAAHLQGAIVTGFEDDFAKYKRRLDNEHLRETFRSAALQVGISTHFWINLLLTLCGGIPGMIHALWLVLTNKSG